MYLPKKLVKDIRKKIQAKEISISLERAANTFNNKQGNRNNNTILRKRKGINIYG